MIRRTRIKFCGLTRPEDLRYALTLGVDAIGLVFCEQSSRVVSLAQAQLLAKEMTPFVSLIGLFMDNTATEVSRIIKGCPSISVLQFHGVESGAFCRQFGMPYMKALPMNDQINFDQVLAEYPDALGFVADSHSVGQVGGSGQVFDWQKLPVALNAPIVLAGGLSADNVKQAILAVAPYAVDVSSGIEQDKGIKDPAKMARFVTAVHAADQ